MNRRDVDAPPPAPRFPAPTDVLAPSWATDVGDWEWLTGEDVWERTFSRSWWWTTGRVLVDVVQTMHADGQVRETPAEVVIDARELTDADDIRQVSAWLLEAAGVVQNAGLPTMSSTARPASARNVLTVVEQPLPRGYLGFTDASRGLILMEPRQRPRKWSTTLLHEVGHFLLGHSRPPGADVEDAIERFAVRAADELLEIAPAVWGAA